MDLPSLPLVTTFGTYSLGADLTAAAWPSLTQLFTGGDPLLFETFNRPPCPVINDVRRLPKGYLRDHPVDLLVLGNTDRVIADEWIRRIPRQEDLSAPKLVIEFWEPWNVITEGGPVSKLSVTKWSQLGYSSTCRTANSTNVVGVVDREWILCARRNAGIKFGWTWPELPPEVICPMANCLRPFGVPWAAYRQVHKYTPDRPLPSAIKDCMPSHPGALITTEKGSRRLLHDELANGLGVPKKWHLTYPPGDLVRCTVALHLLEYLTPLLLRTDESVVPKLVPSPVSAESDVMTFLQEGDGFIIFEWKPPDLSPGSTWNLDRIDNLIAACNEFPNPEALIAEGMDMLERHRGNYDDHGPTPTYLQLLWWEFPRQHWDNMREGDSMNFLKEPINIVTPNSEMTDEQVEVAEAFLVELVSLGVLIKVDLEYIKANAPVFCLPKPGQPGEWRVLSDMKRGRQNEVIGSDPGRESNTGTLPDCPNPLPNWAVVPERFWNCAEVLIGHGSGGVVDPLPTNANTPAPAPVAVTPTPAPAVSSSSSTAPAPVEAPNDGDYGIGNNRDCCRDGISGLKAANGCAGYVNCVDGQNYGYVACRDGLSFNENVEYCDWDYNVLVCEDHWNVGTTRALLRGGKK